jgi:uncharacterized protein (DUF2062 family)
MGRGAKVAITLGAALVGFLIGAWVTTLYVPAPDSECVITLEGTSCTMYATGIVWRCLIGGVPAAIVFAALAIFLVRRLGVVLSDPPSR